MVVAGVGGAAALVTNSKSPIRSTLSTEPVAEYSAQASPCFALSLVSAEGIGLRLPQARAAIVRRVAGN